MIFTGIGLAVVFHGVGMSSLGALVKSGKLRVLAVTGETRAPVLPEIPTFKEAGYPDLTVDVAYFLNGPIAEEVRRTPGLKLTAMRTNTVFFLDFVDRVARPRRAGERVDGQEDHRRAAVAALAQKQFALEVRGDAENGHILIRPAAGQGGRWPCTTNIIAGTPNASHTTWASTSTATGVRR